MKVAVVLLATLVVAYGAPQKRFFLTDIQNAFNTLAHQLNDVIHNAKEQFNQLASGYNVNFNNVVELLVDQIDSGMTEAGCSHVCEGGAATILGPAAPIASLVCGPACNAALAKIEEAAG